MADDIKSTMLGVAKSIGDEAKLAATPFSERIDALKALTAMYAALHKHPSEDDPDKAGDGFDFSKGVAPDEEPPNGSGTVTPIRTRRRPG